MSARNVSVDINVDGHLDELIRQIAHNRQEALTELDGLFRSRVGGFLFKSCGDRWLADELTNETLLRAYKSLDSYRGQSSRQFLSFLFSIAVNLLRDHLRRRRGPQVGFPQEVVAEVRSGCSDYNSSNSIEVKERNAMLREALDSLSAEETILISLSHIEELSADEIAQILGKRSAQAVRTGLCRAMKNLRAVLKRQKYFTHVPA